jgi:hypothetical protein
MRNNIRLLLIFISAATLISCEPTLHVTSDYDKSVNFTNYSTFAVQHLSEKDQTISELNVDRIVNAIKAEMIAKGFKEDAAAPQLKVIPVTIFTAKQEVTANTNYYGYGGVYRPYGWGTGMSSGYTTYNVDDYTDGSLIIDVVDASTNKLVWEGVGNKEIDKPSKNLDEAIPAAIKKIMEGFPPGQSDKKK